MKRKFTFYDLVAYLYGELPAAEQEDLRHAIATDAGLSNEYYRLKEGFDLLPEVEMEPSSHVIDNILLYSQITAAEELQLL